MNQLHKRFTVEQIKVLLQGYRQGNIARTDLQELLGIGKTRFFALLKAYRHDPEAFSIAYQRETPSRLSAEVEAEIERELRREQNPLDDQAIRINHPKASFVPAHCSSGGRDFLARTPHGRLRALIGTLSWSPGNAILDYKALGLDLHQESTPSIIALDTREGDSDGNAKVSLSE